MGVDEEAMIAMISGMGDLPVSIWIDNENSLPTKYDLDMMKMMNVIMQSIMVEYGGTGDEVTISHVLLSMTVTSINNVDSIEVLAEALAS